MRRGKMIAILAMLVVLVAIPALAQEARPLTIRQVDEIPPNAIPILYNGGFEADPPDDGWQFLDQYSGITESVVYSGEHALKQGGFTSTSTTAIHLLEGIDFSKYKEPLYLSMCIHVFTWEMFTDEWDVCEGSFYTRAGMSVAYLWKFTNEDGELPSYNCYTYRVDGLTAWGDELVLRVAALNNPTNATTCTYDVFQIWGIPAFKYRTFMPAVQKES